MRKVGPLWYVCELWGNLWGLSNIVMVLENDQAAYAKNQAGTTSSNDSIGNKIEFLFIPSKFYLDWYEDTI